MHLEGADAADVAHRVGGAAEVVREDAARGRFDVAGAAEHVPGEREVAGVAEGGERLGDGGGLLRDQELVGVDEGHPAEGAAEVGGGVGVGEHLVVDLRPSQPSEKTWRQGTMVRAPREA